MLSLYIFRLCYTNIQNLKKINALDIVEFDNYYSWFSAKKLRYNIEIDEVWDINRCP